MRLLMEAGGQAGLGVEVEADVGGGESSVPVVVDAEEAGDVGRRRGWGLCRSRGRCRRHVVRLVSEVGGELPR